MKSFYVAIYNEVNQCSFIKVNAITANEANELALNYGYKLYYPQILPKETEENN